MFHVFHDGETNPSTDQERLGQLKRRARMFHVFHDGETIPEWATRSAGRS